MTSNSNAVAPAPDSGDLRQAAQEARSLANRTKQNPAPPTEIDSVELAVVAATQARELIANYRQSVATYMKSHHHEDFAKTAAHEKALLDLLIPALMPAAEAWRPMATAPKDGTEILLWLRAPYSRVEALCWRDLVGGWLPVEINPKDAEGMCGAEVPVGWMPMPAGPWWDAVKN